MPRPDEGLIHAWLDGQLPPEDAARVEQMAAADPEWGAAVAEARGLIAASSRILSSLDRAPAGVIPERKTLQLAWRMPWWTKVAAAVVVVAGGSLLVFERANVPEMATAPAAKSAAAGGVASPANAPVAAQAPATATPAGKTSPSSPTSRARQVAEARTENTENTAMLPAPTAGTTAELRPKAASADRAVPAMPPSLLSKDVATKVAEAAPPAVARPSPGTGAVTALRAAGGVAAGGVAAGGVAAGGVAAGGVAAGGVAAGGVAAGARPAEPAGADAQVTRRVSGVAAAPADIQARVARCFRVRDPKVLTDAGVIMRMMNADGDTLRLESVQGQSRLRAWIVWRDGLGHGAMTAVDGTSAVAIIATVSTCPAP